MSLNPGNFQPRLAQIRVALHNPGNFQPRLAQIRVALHVRALVASAPEGMQGELRSYLSSAANRTIDQFIARGQLQVAADIAQQVGHPSAPMMRYLSGNLAEYLANQGISAGQFLARRIQEDPQGIAQALGLMGLPTQLMMERMLGADAYRSFQREVAEGGVEAARNVYDRFMALARDGELTPLQAQILGAGTIVGILGMLATSGARGAYREIAESSFFSRVAGNLLSAERVAAAEFQTFQSQSTRFFNLLQSGNLPEDALMRNGTRGVLNQGTRPTCGHNSCGMVLDTLGRPVDVDALIARNLPRADGVGLDTLVGMLEREGVQASLRRNVTLDQIRELTRDGTPLIAAVSRNGGGHAIVVDGVTMRNGIEVVAIRDPWGVQYFQPAVTFMTSMRINNFSPTVIVPGGR